MTSSPVNGACRAQCVYGSDDGCRVVGLQGLEVVGLRVEGISPSP